MESSSGDGLEGGGDNFSVEELTAIVGGEKPELCKALIQLVMADSAYVKNSDQGTCMCNSYHYSTVHTTLDSSPC